MTSLELIRQDESGVYCEQDIAWMLIKFAKYHVEKALEAASIYAEMEIIGLSDAGTEYGDIDKDSILNAYPLENIK